MSDVKVVAFLVSSRTGAIHAHYTIDGLPGEHGMELPLENFLPHIRADVEALAAIVQTATSDSWRDSLADASKLPETLANVRAAREAHAASETARAAAEKSEQDAKARTAQLEAQHAELETKLADLQAAAEAMVAKRLAEAVADTPPSPETKP